MSLDYEKIHANPSGPGDSRPTALDIMRQEGLIDPPQLTNKVVVLTGSTSGIGEPTALALAEAGAHLLLPVRNTTAGNALKKKIEALPTSAKASVFECDLTSLSSVRSCAAAICKEFSKVDLLILNAGIAGPPLGHTEDGHELQFQVNHLAGFLLFQDLLPLLQKAEDGARVVWVSSIAHRFGTPDTDDYDWKKRDYDPLIAYGASKTAAIWASNEIDRRFGGQGIHSISVHPGGIQTGLQRSHSEEYAAKMEAYFKEFPEILKTFKSLEQGASTTILAAVGKDFQDRGALYMEDCREVGVFEETDRIDAPGYAAWITDMEKAKQVYEDSLKMIENVPRRQ
jgi:NAD(P)-dependent dehydrogenase (short-subunit alcohol dehydrogenase family)